MTRVGLPALTPDGWPLGYLAAAGTLRLLAEEGGHDRLRLYWPPEWYAGPVLEGGPWHSPDEVAAELGAIARSTALFGRGETLPGCDPSFPPAKAGTKGGDPARPALDGWQDLYGWLSEPERRWLDALMIPDPRSLVLHALTHAGGRALLPQAAADQAQLMLGAGHRIPDAALQAAASWLSRQNAIRPAAAGVPGMFGTGKKTALPPALRERLGKPFLTPYMAPTGQQTVRSFFRRPLDAVRAGQDLLAEALADWRWHEGHTTEGLDYRGFSDAASTPYGKALHHAPVGAVWLAAMALPLDPLRADPAGMVRTGLWAPRGDGLMVMSMPLWDEALDVTQVRALFRDGGALPGAGVWRTDQAIRLQPPGSKHSRGLVSSADLNSPLRLPLPDLEWRISAWWADLPGETPAPVAVHA